MEHTAATSATPSRIMSESLRAGPHTHGCRIINDEARKDSRVAHHEDRYGRRPALLLILALLVLALSNQRYWRQHRAAPQLRAREFESTAEAAGAMKSRGNRISWSIAPATWRNQRPSRSFWRTTRLRRRIVPRTHSSDWQHGGLAGGGLGTRGRSGFSATIAGDHLTEEPPAPGLMRQFLRVGGGLDGHPCLAGGCSVSRRPRQRASPTTNGWLPNPSCPRTPAAPILGWLVVARCPISAPVVACRLARSVGGSVEAHPLRSFDPSSLPEEVY